MRINVEITCPFCGNDHAVEVDLAQFEAWQDGELIQKAMPDLTLTEREQLISGLCPKCQVEIFGPNIFQKPLDKLVKRCYNKDTVKERKRGYEL